MVFSDVPMSRNIENHPDFLEFKGKDGFDKAPSVTNGDGDGTVNALSLRLCDGWTKPGVQTRSAKVEPLQKGCWSKTVLGWLYGFWNC